MRALRFVVPCLALAAAALAQGKVFLTPEEALALAFPGCASSRKEHVLDDAQRARIVEVSGQEATRSMVIAYEARRDGELVGTAYFDRHRVRSLHELIMVVVDTQGRCARIEVLAFGEPLDYLPRGTFYGQFAGRALDAELSTKRAVKSVAGATLTVEATVAAVRRVLATHATVYPDQRPKPPGGEEPPPSPAPDQPSPRT